MDVHKKALLEARQCVLHIPGEDPQLASCWLLENAP
jgi:hypothetical protein